MEIKETEDIKVNPTVSKICMLMSAICMGSVGLFVTLLGNYQVYTIVLLRGIFGVFFLTFFMITSVTILNNYSRLLSGNGHFVKKIY